MGDLLGIPCAASLFRRPSYVFFFSFLPVRAKTGPTRAGGGDLRRRGGTHFLIRVFFWTKKGSPCAAFPFSRPVTVIWPESEKPGRRVRAGGGDLDMAEVPIFFVCVSLR